MDRLTDRMPVLVIALWGLAIVVALGIAWAFAPVLFTATATVPTATTSPRQFSTPRVTWIVPSTWTSIPLPPPVAAGTALPIPTPPANAQEFVFSADSKRSGWFTSKETGVHWGDRNLHAGAYQAQVFQTLLYFDVSQVIPDSKILYASVELVGLNRNNLGSHGEWTLRLLSPDLLPNWTTRPNQDFRDALPVATIGNALKPADLAEERLNQFVFTPTQLPRVEEMTSNLGVVAFRLDGPTDGGNSLFTWDAGDRDPKTGVRPILRMIVIPDQYVFITQTPTPRNVLTAAAIVAQGTAAAQQYGTPTPFPRKYATSLPLVPITPQPTPANVETVNAQVRYATAVAMTTGTFTPTPSNWVTTTPLPPFIPFANLSPSPTATPTPTRLTVLQSAIRPIPAQFFNRIIFQRGDRGNPTFVVIDPDGQNQGLVTDRSVYETAVARDAFSPEGTFLLYNAPSIDFPDTLQIWIQYQGIPTAPPQRLTWHRIGLAYAPAWAPCCNKFAYVSSETGRDEIWLFDLDAKKTQKLTTSAEWNWNQFPSWSPDSKQIVFSSDRGRPGMFTDIWVMNADGTNARKISDGIRDAWAPVWIKWKQ